MTVAELIEQLGALAPGLTVWVGKGIGPIASVELNSGVIILYPERFKP